MKKSSRKMKLILLGVIGSLILVCIGVRVNQAILSKWKPDEKIVGTWIGTGETRQFGQLEAIEVRLTVDTEGNVSGLVGDALLEKCVIELNRNDFERRINVKTDYIIRAGYIEGTIVKGDELSFRETMMPFDIKDGRMEGTIFHVEDWSYPDPLLLHVELQKIGDE